MNSEAKLKSELGVLEMLVVSVFSGLVLGLLLLCFMRPIASLFGGLTHDFGGLVRRGVTAGFIGLVALLPTVAVFQRRSDLTAFLLSGPQIGSWAIFAYFVGGTYRGWGSPPDFAWPLAGCFVMYVIFLSVAALVFVRKTINSND